MSHNQAYFVYSISLRPRSWKVLQGKVKTFQAGSQYLWIYTAQWCWLGLHLLDYSCFSRVRIDSFLLITWLKNFTWSHQHLHFSAFNVIPAFWILFMAANILSRHVLPCLCQISKYYLSNRVLLEGHLQLHWFSSEGIQAGWIQTTLREGALGAKPGLTKIGKAGMAQLTLCIMYT